MRLEVTVTLRCNAVCRWCNRLVGVADIEDSDMTPQEARHIVDVLKRDGERITRLTIAGGEPLVNPHLQEIVDIFGELENVHHGRVLTNGEDPEGRERIRLPDNYRWVIAPLSEKVHYPFLVSPADLGYEETGEKCTVKGWCGKGADCWGFSTCGVMGILARMLRIDPYDKDHVVRDTRADICRHCIYSLPRRKQDRIIRKLKAGEFKHPTPTYREALQKYREDPFVFERIDTTGTGKVQLPVLS